VVREYAVDMYGNSDSPLHRGLGTDRFVVSWELDTPRVEARIAGQRPPSSRDFEGLELVFPVHAGASGPEPEAPPGSAVAGLLERGARSRGLRLPIPADIQSLRDRDPALAGRWRNATRAVLEPALREGWVVRELLPPSPVSVPVSHYVLEPGPGDEEARGIRPL
jgi:predicted GNAT superfamily acetyltransferase